MNAVYGVGAQTSSVQSCLVVLNSARTESSKQSYAHSTRDCTQADCTASSPSPYPLMYHALAVGRGVVSCITRRFVPVIFISRSSMAHLDTQLRAKHQVAPRRIEFAPARHPEAASFQWNPKYPPINGTAPIRSTDPVKHKAEGAKTSKQVAEPTYEVPLPPAGLQWSEQRRKPNACLACELERHIYNALSRKRNTSFAPKNIVGNLKRIGKHFRLGRQEDSHEFIRYLIEGVQHAMSVEDKLTRVDQGALFSVFGGYLQSQVKCQQCGYESNTIDPVLDISLEIKSKHINSIQSALTHFCAPEILDGDNKYKCPRCNKKVRAQKQFTIRQPPHVLTLQLKRFGFMGLFGGNNKITKTIQYPDLLTLDPYLSHRPQHAQSYSLYGVLVHTGSSTHSGHYFSFVRAANQQWYRCDDHHVSQVSHATALQQNAYLLFYVKNEHATPAKSPLKSPNGNETRVKQTNGNDKQGNGHNVTPVKQGPVKPVQYSAESNGHVDESTALSVSPVTPVKQSNTNETRVKQTNGNDKQENGHSVTPVKQAPKSIRGSGEWRVRDLSALSTLLNGNHVTPVSETPVQHSVNTTTAEVTDVKVSSAHVNNSKPSNDNRSNTASVTRVKVSAAPSPKSVVEQLQTLSQSHASAWDVPDGARVLAEQQSLVQQVSGVKRKRDEYDVDYDRGKVKKSKRQHIDPFQGTHANPFQAAQNHAIASKRPFSGMTGGGKKNNKHQKKNKKKHFKRD